MLVVRHDVNRGKGAAVRTAIARSTGDIVVIEDADLEHDPRDIARLLEPLTRGVADAVYGSRLRGGAPQRAHLFWHHAASCRWSPASSTTRRSATWRSATRRSSVT